MKGFFFKRLGHGSAKASGKKSKMEDRVAILKSFVKNYTELFDTPHCRCFNAERKQLLPILVTFFNCIGNPC